MEVDGGAVDKSWQHIRPKPYVGTKGADRSQVYSSVHTSSVERKTVESEPTVSYVSGSCISLGNTWGL